MYGYILCKDNPVWIWVALDRLSRWVLEIYIGDRTNLDCHNLYSEIQDVPTKIYATDHYISYKQILPKEKHITGKEHTSMVENFNGRVRHYLARFHRRTKCYSKSLEMMKHHLRLLVYYKINVETR
jgi:insertion element IS1 protein InsB